MLLNLDTASVLATIIDPYEPRKLQIDMLSAACRYQEVDKMLHEAVQHLRKSPKDLRGVKSYINGARKMANEAMAFAIKKGWIRPELAVRDRERLSLIERQLMWAEDTPLEGGKETIVKQLANERYLILVPADHRRS